MPRYSDDTIFQQAINPAIQDRLSFSDCYGGKGEESDSALLLVKRMKALEGRKLSVLSAEEYQVACAVFIFAEQWEDSLADAQADTTLKDRSNRLALRFRNVRLRRWGKTKLEMIYDTYDSSTNWRVL